MKIFDKAAVRRLAAVASFTMLLAGSAFADGIPEPGQITFDEAVTQDVDPATFGGAKRPPGTRGS